jgi:hypothetical protein
MKTTTLKEFKKDFVIYKSHKLANGFISITFASRLSTNTVSTQTTIKVENIGGAWKSLYNSIVVAGQF